jgi:hypothetical protein
MKRRVTAEPAVALDSRIRDDIKTFKGREVCTLRLISFSINVFTN